MKENKLAELSMEFSVDIIGLVKQLKSNHESIISNQIGRSGTSIGANIHEAQYLSPISDALVGLFPTAKKHVFALPFGFPWITFGIYSNLPSAAFSEC